MTGLLLCLSLLLPLSAPALSVEESGEERRLHGTVRTVSGEAVEGVVVTLTEGDRVMAYGITDGAGRFSVGHPSAADSLTLCAEHLSFETFRTRIPAETEHIDIVLREEERVLREVIVRAPPVRMRGDTLSYDLRAFASENDRSLRDALKRLPGVEVEESGRIKYLGKAISNFYIEGLDLLGGKYNLATENIPADYVSAVEVLNHHNASKIARGDVSDNVAVNIRLAEKAKLRPFGTYEATGGLSEEGGLYRLGGAGMLFSPRFQAVVTAKAGNVEEFSRSMDADLIGTDSGPASVVSDILGELSASSPPIGRNRYICPGDRSLHADLLRKVSDDIQLKLNAGYAGSTAEYGYGTRRTYFSEAGDIVIEQRLAPWTRKHEPSLSFEYRDDGENRLVHDTFTARAAFSRSDLPTATGMEEVFQQERYRDFDLRNEFKLSWRKGRLRWSASSSQRLSLTPQGSVDMGNGLSQTADGSRMAVRGRLSATYEKLNARFFFPLELNLTSDRIRTELQDRGVPDSERSSHRMLPPEWSGAGAGRTLAQAGQGVSVLGVNDLDAGLLQLSFLPRYEYSHPGRKFFFWIAFGLLGEGFDRKNTGSVPVQTKDWKFSVRPDLYLRYVPDRRSTLTLTLDRTRGFGDLTDFLTAPVQTDLTSRRTGSGAFSGRTSATAGLRYDFKLPLEMWFVNAGLSWTHSRDDRMRNQEVSADHVTASQLPVPGLSDAVRGDFTVTKQVQSIRTKVSLRATFSDGRSQVAQNGTVYRIFSRQTGLAPTLTSRPSRFLELDYSGRFERVASAFRPEDDAAETRKSYRLQFHSLSVKWTPVQGFQIFAGADIAWRELASGTAETLPLFDGGISWRRKALRIDLGLRNLLDRRNYRYTVYDAVNTFTCDYRLRGREWTLSLIYTR